MNPISPVVQVLPLYDFNRGGQVVHSTTTSLLNRCCPPMTIIMEGKGVLIKPLVLWIALCLRTSAVVPTVALRAVVRPSCDNGAVHPNRSLG